MSRNFKNYAKRIRHHWMNNPDSAHQVCTACGLYRKRFHPEGNNYVMVTVYYRENGVEYEENQPCINN